MANNVFPSFFLKLGSMLGIGKVARQTLLIDANYQLLELGYQDLKLLTSGLWMLGKVAQIQVIVMAVAIVMTMRTMRIMVIGMGVKP